MFRPRLPSAAAMALLLSGACKDSATEPELDLTVQLTATASEPARGRSPEGEPTLACSITFQADVTGEKGVTGEWTGGILRFYVGTDALPLDSLPLPAAQVQQAFGGNFGTGAQRRAGVEMTARVPFSVEMEVRYRVSGSRGTARASSRASCGMPSGAPTGPPPALTGISIVAPPDGVEPGDTVRVAWTATGSALWETGVEVEGAFQAGHPVTGDGRATITHTAQVVVPRTARLGETFRLRVYAADVWLRTAASTPWTSPALVDRTPPAIDMVRTTRFQDRWESSLVGQYGARDTLVLYVYGHDNHRLAYAVYQFGPQGVRDSVAVGSLMDGIRVPLRAEMAGSTEFRVHLRDEAGNRTPDFVAAPGEVRVYPERPATVHTVLVPERPLDVLVDPARGRMYTLLVNRNELRVYALPALTLERTVPLTFTATSLELTADGDSLLLSAHHYGGIAVMDVNAAVQPAVRLLPGVAQVHGIRIGATGRAIALAGGLDGKQSVLEVDLGAGTQRVLVPSLQVPDPWEGVTRSRDRRKMLLGAGCPFDVATEQVGTCRMMRTDIFLGPVNGDDTGARWGRSLGVYDADLLLAQRIHDPLGEFMAGTVPVAGGEVLVGGRRGLVRVRSDGTFAERLAAPPLVYLRLSDNRAMLASWGMEPPAGSPHRIHVLDLR